MSLEVVSPFMNRGSPASGLNPLPTVRIRRTSDGVLVVTDAAMVEVGDAQYKYVYAGYDSALNYTIRCDAGAALTGYDRYTFGDSGLIGEATLILEDTGTTLQATVDAIETDTQDIQGRIPAALSSGNIKADVLAISTSTAAADNLEASAETIVKGTVSHDNTASSKTVFYSDDITEATAEHFYGRIIIFTSGALIYQATDIVDYALVSGEGQFTVGALTDAPADNITFVII